MREPRRHPPASDVAAAPHAPIEAHRGGHPLLRCRLWLQVLLSAGASGVRPRSDGRTPAWGAAFHGHVGVIEALAAKGVPLDTAAVDGTTPLWAACEGGSLPGLKFLLSKGCSHSPITQDKTSPVLAAARNGHTDVVRALIEAGANPNSPNKARGTQRAAFTLPRIPPPSPPRPVAHSLPPRLYCPPLSLATMVAWKRAQDSWEINGPAAPALQDCETPALAAARRGHAETLAALADGKADVVSMNEDGVHPLWLAASSGHSDAVEASVPWTPGLLLYVMGLERGLLWTSWGSGHTCDPCPPHSRPSPPPQPLTRSLVLP